jgi:6-phosphogluconolactonase
MPSLPSRIFPDKEALTAAVAGAVIDRIREAVDDHGRCAIALAGGSTPEALYALLAGDAGRGLPWEAVHAFFGDERYVPHDDEKSNFRMARRALLDHVPIPAAQVHPMPTDATDPHEAAAAYEADLREYFGEDPRFDVILLGMGDDGHTASLFPGSPALDERTRWVVAAPSPAAPHQRLTLTFPVLNRAAHVYFLVAGAAKVEALRCVSGYPSGVTECPSASVRPADGELAWWIDEAAAAGLKPPV